MLNSGSSSGLISSDAYPRNASIVDLFEDCAAQTPHAVAVVSGARELTYRQLDDRSNTLALHLLHLGLEPEGTVAVGLARSPDLIVALLAILKAGGAYVPFEASFPADRIAQMIADAGARFTILDQPVAGLDLSALGTRAVTLADVAQAPSNLKPPKTATAAHLAYVMYTSGSTGRPKGVCIEHRAVVRLVRNTNYCDFGPHQTFLLFSPVSFDASTLEIWGPLLNGGKLALMPAGDASLADLGHAIGAHRVTTLWLTAGLFHTMVEQRLDDLAPLRQLIAGGDVLSASHVNRVLARHPQLRLTNGYGPTENTTFSCCHVFDAGSEIADPVPIGRPISHTRIYVLDEALRPVPPGEVGELFVAGDGLARGYLNNAALTAETFLMIDDGVGGTDRAYRTGDRVRLRPDGALTFLGRTDNQIKLRGFRIELNEVELAIQMHGQVLQACVVVEREGLNARHLLAAVKPQSGVAIDAHELKAWLRQRVPPYMVPALIEVVADYPLNANGKIDRERLLAALKDAFARQARDAGAVATSDPTRASLEATIASVWQRTLGVPSVSLDRNFFDLGGDSLRLVAAGNELERALARQIPVVVLLECTTIRKLAARLSENARSGMLPAGPTDDRANRQRAAFSARRPVAKRI